MGTINKWRFENSRLPAQASPVRMGINSEPDMISGWVVPGTDHMLRSGTDANIPTLNLRSRSVVLLMDSLRDLGLDELSRDELDSCPESVISLVWKLVSECQQAVRQVQQARETWAKTENENKQLKTRVSRQSDDLSRLRSDLKERENEFRRKEELMQAKIDELSRNRFEWEKTALTYKGREKKFVAEMKKQGAEYERLQDRMRRSFSIQSRYSPPPASTEAPPVTFSLDRVPPLAPARAPDEWIPRLNLR